MDLQNFIEKSNFDKKEHYIVDACLNIASSALGCSENEVNKIKENFLKQIELQFYSINAIHHNHFHKINQKDTISPKFNELIVKIADTLVKDCDKKTTEISDILHWHDKNYNIPFDCNEGLIDRYKAELKAELNDIGDLEIVVRDEKGQNANNNIKNIKSYGAFASREAQYYTQDYKNGGSDSNSKRSPKSKFTAISCDELGDKNCLLNKTTGLKNNSKGISGCSIS